MICALGTPSGLDVDWFERVIDLRAEDDDDDLDEVEEVVDVDLIHTRGRINVFC